MLLGREGVFVLASRGIADKLALVRFSRADLELEWLASLGAPDELTCSGEA